MVVFPTTEHANLNNSLSQSKHPTLGPSGEDPVIVLQGDQVWRSMYIGKNTFTVVENQSQVISYFTTSAYVLLYNWDQV